VTTNHVTEAGTVVTRKAAWPTVLAVLSLTVLLTACGSPASVLPPIKAHPALKPATSHPVEVVGLHPALTANGATFTVFPKPLTRRTLYIFIRSGGHHRRRVLVAISGLGYKWLKRWQVADHLLLLEVAEPSTPHPRSSEYEHILIAVDWKTHRILYQGPVAVTTIAYLDPPWLVKAGPASIIGTRSAVWLLNLRTGLEQSVLLPVGAVATGEVANGRVYVQERVHGRVRQASVPIPKTGWRKFHSIPILTLEAVTPAQQPAPVLSGAGRPAEVTGIDPM